MKLCECGCGHVVNPGTRFLHGHWHRGKHKKFPLIQGPLQLCECGCGQVVNHISYRFISNHPYKKSPLQGPLPLCKCGCGKVVNNIGKEFIQNHSSKFYKKLPIQGPLPLCECGCGKVVISVKSKFIYRHRIVKPPVQGPLPLCKCGCGRVVTKIQNRFITGHAATVKIKKSTLRKTPTNRKNYCKMCKSKKSLERHHIIPRKYGVNNDEYNLITLCKNCHDKVEILTTDWIDSGKEYSALIFRRLITNMW